MEVEIPTGRPIRNSTLWASYLARRYAVLFYALLGMLVVIPTAGLVGLPQLGVKLALGACLLAAVLPSATRRNRNMLILGVISVTVARLITDREDVPISSAWMVAMVGLIGLAAAAGALRFAFASPKVQSETIYAALSTYLLAGLFFGQIYWAIESAMPGSFTGPDPFSDVNSVYYSFVTLATLGYGDFLPRNDIARGVAVFEVIGGQLFLAVMVARLIGMFGGADSDNSHQTAAGSSTTEDSAGSTPGAVVPTHSLKST